MPDAAIQTPLWKALLDASLFGVLGIALLVVGYYIWEAITPYNNRRELHENKNTAVAVVVVPDEDHLTVAPVIITRGLLHALPPRP